MSNFIYIGALLLCISAIQTVSAQTPWYFNGNSSSGQYIGTNSAQPFPIRTDNVERMRIDANGNVGIGTTSPLYLLDIYKGTVSNVIQRFSNSVTGDYYNNGFQVGIDNTGTAILRQNYSSGDILLTVGPSSGIRIQGLSGYVGIGHLGYFTPQSAFHLHREANSIYSQITSTITGYASTDGLKIGINSDAAWAYDPIAEIRQQENTAMTLFTNSAERIRIMHTGALDNGVAFNPGGLASNLTRIGISHNPSTPVTHPLSLLHLGYNTANATTNDGWRSWMDVGMFVSQNSDHVYLGMKSESTGSDAVLNWGDNSWNDASGPDNFRVIFTSPYNASTTGLYGSTQNGVEGLRMTPTPLGQSINTGIGGDAANGNPYVGSSANPTATLEVNSWNATSAAGGSSGLRFTNLNTTSPTTANPGTGILSVNANGDVIYVPCCSSGTVSACGSPTAGYVPKWCGLGSGVMNSIIYDDSTRVGIGTAAPANRLEINHDSSGNSGLRFTQLTASTIPVSNSGLGVLAVDAEGDVVYVEANNAPNIGNYCGSTPKPLTSNFEVPLNDKNYYFSGQGTNPDTNNIGSSVAIGLNCGDPIPLAKLHVLQSAVNPNQVIENEDSISTAAYFENNATGKAVLGAFGIANGDTKMNIGGRFEAHGSTMNASQSGIGVWGIAIDALDRNAGVRGEAFNGDYNYGVYGLADSGSNSYAIYGEAPHSYGSAWAGYFVGDVLSTTGNYQTSDKKLKENIKDISNSTALLLINNLMPKTYNYNTGNYPSMNLSQSNQYGLIAQDVETVLPELVKDVIHPATKDKRGNIIHQEVSYKALNYTGLIPIIIGAVKEQQYTIDSLKDVIDQRLSALENRVNTCCGSFNSYKTDPNSENTNYQTVNLSNLQTIILDQNTPNPFAEQTTISYFLPDNIKTAAIIFYNAEGREINRAEIATRGKGAINVYAQDLSSGIYSYTLIADGKVTDTKRMVKR
ncbi:MAG: tail fiber domain-containing protein [Chitinophagales bacterium]|nr:tail fiber domain-containing protein [Chitinophagales bacterium]